MTRNGMQGAWTRPPRTSPIPAAILAALPKDGSTITRRELIAAVQKTCTAAAITIGTRIHEMANSRSYGITRAGYGLYQAAAPGEDQP